MLSRLSLAPLTLVALVPLLSLACQVDVQGGDLSKDEARALQGIDQEGNDLCSLHGWYDDDVCDDFCSEPDPDCPVSNCPDPNDPRVYYRGGPDDDQLCAQEIDFCGPDQVMFNSPDCGCGCITPDPVVQCGGEITSEACEPDEFCSYDVDAMCGWADATGTCAPIPEACDLQYAPVCGCDGETYSNDCAANASGTSVLHEGACDSEPQQTCGGIAGVMCDPGDFCNMDGMCQIDDGLGVCEPLPEGCPENWDPVCSCEGVTYGNECAAHMAGASVWTLGECATRE